MTSSGRSVATTSSSADARTGWRRRRRRTPTTEAAHAQPVGRRLARSCAATRCSGSSAILIASSCSMAIFPRLFTSTDPTRVPSCAQVPRAGPSADALVRLRPPGLRLLRPRPSTARARRILVGVLCTARHRAHRRPRRHDRRLLRRLGRRALSRHHATSSSRIPFLLGAIMFLARCPSSSTTTRPHRPKVVLAPGRSSAGPPWPG